MVLNFVLVSPMSGKYFSTIHFSYFGTHPFCSNMYWNVLIFLFFLQPKENMEYYYETLKFIGSDIRIVLGDNGSKCNAD